MKLLILSMCVCMAVAAPQRFGGGPLGKAASVVASPFVAAAQVTAKVASTAAKTYAGASGSDKDAQILRSESDVRADGYSFISESDNGISSQAEGTLRQVGDQAAVVVKGSYNYVAADGTPVRVDYIADENGYQPQSDILPVGPPVPQDIARSLEYIATHPQEPGKKY